MSSLEQWSSHLPKKNMMHVYKKLKMVRGTISKSIFIDSSINTHNDETKVIVPAHPFSCTGSERMALTLVSFGMRRGWHNINPTNGIFYLHLNGAYHEVVITAGTYSTFALLTDAINTALAATVAGIAAITSVLAAYDDTTRRFTFVATMSAGNAGVEVQVRCFLVKGGALPAGVSIRGGYNDSFVILGAKPIKIVAEAFNSLSQPGAINTLVSSYTASLNTLDGVYIHATSIETGNYMSTGFESHAQDSLRLIESSIFARIPFDDTTWTESHEVVQFEDNGGDMFQSFLSRKSIDTLSLKITDARGRSLAHLDPTQADNGLMAYRMCLRWDLFPGPPTPQPRHALAFEHPPTA